MAEDRRAGWNTISVGLLTCTTLGLAASVGCGGAAPAAEQVTLVTSPRASLPGLDALALDDEHPCGIGTVYFRFDSSRLSEPSKRALRNAADCLSRPATPPVRLIGNADPRGTEEYNLALGERRAKTVYNYLLDLGVDPVMVSFSSFGEELAQGEDEATWALDRNVAAQTREGGAMLATPGLMMP